MKSHRGIPEDELIRFNEGQAGPRHRSRVRNRTQHGRPLAERVRSRLHRALRDEHPEICQALTPKQRHVLSPAKTWNVQIQSVGRGRTPLRYLARYVQRSAFGAKRLLGYDQHGDVRLLWTCSNTKRTTPMTLHPHEFIRRWLLHVLPKGFTRVRHYGLLSSAARKTRLFIRLRLGDLGEPLPEAVPFTCECCGGELTFLREIAPIRLMRGPPRKRPKTAWGEALYAVTQ